MARGEGMTGSEKNLPRKSDEETAEICLEEEKLRQEKIEEVRRRWNDLVMGTYRHDVEKVEYTLGGFSFGIRSVTVTRDADGAVVKYEPFQNTGEETSEKRISTSEWSALIDELFVKIRVHEWKDSYFASGIFDGTQWGIRISMGSGMVMRFQGSNAFPENWEEFRRVIDEIVK